MRIQLRVASNLTNIYHLLRLLVVACPRIVYFGTAVYSPRCPRTPNPVTGSGNVYVCVWMCVLGCTHCLQSHCLLTSPVESGMSSVVMVKSSSSELPSVCSLCFDQQRQCLIDISWAIFDELLSPVMPDYTANTIDSWYTSLWWGYCSYI